MAAGPFGEVYAGGIGVTNHPAFAVIGKAREETGDDPFAGIDESKMEGFMADMEREMGGMDEENPDPRQLGHFMRKMTEASDERRISGSVNFGRAAKSFSSYSRMQMPLATRPQRPAR